MYVLRYFIILPIIEQQHVGIEPQMSDLDFFILTLVVILLTASGNIINDYFDVKVDKINKPEKVLVGKTVKRRVAMALNHGLNITAILFSAYLSLKFHSWTTMLIPLSIATLLWFYSPIFKKQIFIGNIIVAICVAIIPLWTGVFELIALKQNYPHVPEISEITQTILKWLGIYALFAFLISLSREAYKDLEDLQGDKIGEYKTLPLVLGENFAKIYASAMMLICLIAVSYFYHSLGYRLGVNIIESIGVIVLVMAPGLLSIYFGLSSKHKIAYTKASLFSKLTMGGGIILCALAGYFYL
jgi:4-hydroxybenzoate polyprenyltransferase